MAYWNQQLEILKIRSFQFYLYSCIAGTFASGLAYIVTIWMIVKIYTSVNATLVGMILFWIPSLILSSHLGVIVDHYDRKKLIIIAESIRAVMFIAFGILLYYFTSLWAVYLLLFLSGCFAALYKPLLPAFVHELVPTEQLVYANANINMAYEFGNIIGRGIITVAVLSLLGIYGALFTIAILYVISAATMIPVHRHHKEQSTSLMKHPSFIKNMIAGYHYLFSNKELRLYGFIQAGILMSLMAAPVLVGPYVKTILLAGNQIFGISEAVLSIGTIIGAFFWSYLANLISKESCLAGASVFAGLSYLMLANTNSVVFSLIAFLVLGFSWGSFALIVSVVQMIIDKNYQGRVQAAIGAAVTLVYMGFAFFLYILGEQYNVQHAFLFLAFLCLFIFGGSIKARNLEKFKH
jgi:DHA3 family macrolide efflux protein-like MFS transporter